MALDKLTKIDGGGISTTSDYRVGIITASKFIGPFDGTGGNFSGVVTATNGVFSGNISAVDGNFSGNVSIAGTLTYEDVTNIDSVGIITAQKDIHVGAGVSVVGVGTFGSLDISGDIDVDGHTNLDNVSVAGITTVNGGFIFDNGTNAGKDLQWQPTNNRLAFFNDVKATFGNTVDLQIYHSPNENHIYGSTSKPIIFSTNTDERFRINSDGQVSLGDNPTVASDAALHIELTGAREYLRLNADAGNNNAYIEIQADDNRRKALIFKSGGTRRGVIGVGDSDEAANATSLFFSASANAGGNSPHMVITSTGLIGFNNNAPEGKGIDVTHSRTNAYAATSDHRNLAQIIARNGSDAAGRFASISLVSGGSTQAEGSINLVQTGSYTGDLTVKMRSAVSTWAESLRITSDGKIGINQNPTRELSLHSPNNNNALIHFTNDDTGETASDGILVGLNGNEDMIISNQESGRNIIGYTFESGDAGREKFRISHDGAVRLYSYKGNNTDTPGITFRGGSTTQSANFAIIHSRMVSGWGGQLQFKVKDDNGSLSDAYQTAMIMDHNAIIRTPNQCGFHMIHDGNSGDLTSNMMVANWDTDASSSKSYVKNCSFNSGRFVAPVDGLYFFTAQLLLMQVGNGDDSIHLIWTTGSSNTNFSYWNTRHTGESANGNGYGYGGYLPMTGSTTAYLSAGDIFGIKITTNGTVQAYGTDSNWGHWSGYLVG